MLHEDYNSQISEQEKSRIITTHTFALFFAHSQSGPKKLQKHTHD
jgi:hypothetical protein